MYIRVTSTPNSPRKSVKIVEGIRHGLKVKQVMIHHVGVASNEAEIEKLKILGRELIADELLRRAQSSKQIGFLGRFLIRLQKYIEHYALKGGAQHRS